MSHIASRLGDLLHFHPLAYPLRTRDPSDAVHEPDGIDGHIRRVSPDDLSLLGLRAEHRSKGLPVITTVKGYSCRNSGGENGPR